MTDDTEAPAPDEEPEDTTSAIKDKLRKLKQRRATRKARRDAKKETSAERFKRIMNTPAAWTDL